LLVTGGAGFIGSNFVHYWLDHHRGQRVIVLDALTYAGNSTNLQSAESCSDFRFVRGNICDTALVECLLREERIDTVVHFAAESHVDRSIDNPDDFVGTNVHGTYSMLKAARKVWIEEHAVELHRFHHVSTDEVYGSIGRDELAAQEITRYAPNSPYAASKAASDHLVRAYHCTYGLQVTTSNCVNNFGPYQFPEKLIPLMIVNILRGRPLPIYGDGSHRRDWLHVSDHCRAIELILQHGTAGEVYNICGCADWENLRLVHLLCELADEALSNSPSLALKFPQCPAVRGESVSSLIRFVPDRPGHDQRYALNGDKIARECGYWPSISLEPGLRDTFTWYLQNDWWWRGAAGQDVCKWIRNSMERARQ
jgi:dTDP-glucose 4,6-dehydratase